MTGQTNELAAPFPLTQLQDDLVEVYVHHVRNVGHLVNVEAAWALLSNEELSIQPWEFLNPEATAKELGFTFTTIAHTTFAKAMVNLYNYAFFGRLDTILGAPEGESEYVWYTTLCCDAADSPTATERFDYGSDIGIYAKRCVLVAETANARNMLEGQEPYYYFYHSRNNDSHIDFDGLTVRQLALLSGMEEGSVRAAMNPKRAKPLVTFKSGNRTLVNMDVAKEWLMDKGRYVPVIHWRSSTEVNWSIEKIDSADQFNNLLAKHVENIVRAFDFNAGIEFERQLEALGTPLSHPSVFLGNKPFSVSEEQMRDTTLMQKLAKLIEVNPDIFALRAKETALCEEILRLATERKRLTLQ